MFENYWFWMCFATLQSVLLALALIKIFLDETRVEGKRKK